MCGAVLVGAWCHACGQPSRSVPRTFRETLLGQTGRLLHTLLLLVIRPGELAREIDEARDRRSMRPASLLLNLIAFFFIVGGGAGGFTAAAIIARDASGVMARTVAERAERRGIERSVFDERVEQRFRAAYSLLVPVLSSLAYAFMIGLVERGRRKAWLVHFAAAIQYLCATFVVAALLFGVGRLAHVSVIEEPWVQVAVLVVLATYMVAMLMRVYGDRPVVAVAKAAAVLAVGGAVDAALSYAAIGVAILTV
jgi:hypothetical protein